MIGMRGYTISERELQKYINKKNILLIDLRDADDYMSGHLPGAVNIPFDRFREKTDLLKNAFFDMIIFYCERGNLSLRMAGIFVEQGYDAVSLAGGIVTYHGRLV